MSGIFRAGTGEPFLISQPSGISASRPDYTGGDPYNADHRRTLQYLNRAAFARVPLSPVSGTTVRAGNVGNNALRFPGSWNLDFSLAKNIPVGERIKFQFRADAFNFFNHTVFSNISTDITAASFGRFTAAAPARQVQLNARLTF